MQMFAVLPILKTNKTKNHKTFLAAQSRKSHLYPLLYINVLLSCFQFIFF